LAQLTERATAGREVAEVYAEGNADAIAVSDCRDRALDVATGILRVEETLGGESSSVDNSGRVILNDGGIAKDSSNWDTGGLGADKPKESSRQDGENTCGIHFGGVLFIRWRSRRVRATVFRLVQVLGNKKKKNELKWTHLQEIAILWRLKFGEGWTIKGS
jgi:hypothetical protein